MISTANNPTKQSFNGGTHHIPSEGLTPFKANHIVKCEKVGSVHFLDNKAQVTGMSYLAALIKRRYVYPLTTRRTTTGGTYDNRLFGQSKQAMYTNNPLPCAFYFNNGGEL